MNRQHDKPSLITLRHRRLAVAIVGLWLASWSMLVLEPCCEVVAGALPHTHATGPEPGAGGHHHQQNGGPGNDHCQPLENPTGTTALLLGPLALESEVGSVAPDSPDKATPTSFRKHGNAELNPTGRPPPPSLRVSQQDTYLMTQRLRI